MPRKQSTSRNHRSRTALLLLLVMSIALQPVLVLVGSMHQLQHAVVSIDAQAIGHAITHGHSHHAVTDDLESNFTANTESEKQRSDSDGLMHLLLHFSHGCSSHCYTIPAVSNWTVKFSAYDPPAFNESIFSSLVLTQLFRPPISV